jgi:hypothetical protein
MEIDLLDKEARVAEDLAKDLDSVLDAIVRAVTRVSAQRAKTGAP